MVNNFFNVKNILKKILNIFNYIETKTLRLCYCTKTILIKSSRKQGPLETE